MNNIEQLKTTLSNMRYDREYTELNLTERLIVDWEVERELEAFCNYGAGI
jgi:hypothetical protein